jgi:hypothetical protein
MTGVVDILCAGLLKQSPVVLKVERRCCLPFAVGSGVAALLLVAIADVCLSVRCRSASSSLLLSFRSVTPSSLTVPVAVAVALFS